MEHEASKNDAFLVLPTSVVGRVDVGRLLREAEALDNFLTQANLRQPGTPMTLPKMSRLLDETIMVNKVNVLIEAERNRLLHFLMEVYSRAPMLHMSFSADPSTVFVQKLVAWLRQEIHPLVLVQIGLQPNMGAGCVVRTNNKYFDFSLRQRFNEKHDLLAQRLRGAVA
jgi:F0F1-type ATP synthase delta subunit